MQSITILLNMCTCNLKDFIITCGSFLFQSIFDQHHGTCLLDVVVKVQPTLVDYRSAQAVVHGLKIIHIHIEQLE